VEYNPRGGLQYGISNYPIQYDPPISDPSELAVELEPEPQGPGLVPCYRQVEPARQLVGLQDIPVLFLNGEGGYHRIFDHCLADWLNQAGMQTEYVRLEEAGMPGNGHMLMLELNSKEIAQYIGNWLEENVD
jgi:pimeloyl-ACP methyl ester carboxylesterase